MFSPEYAILRIISHNNQPTLEWDTSYQSRLVCDTVVHADPRHLLADDILCLYFGHTYEDITLALQYRAGVHKLTKRADTNEWVDEHGTLSFAEFAKELAACYSFRLVHEGDL